MATCAFGIGNGAREQNARGCGSGRSEETGFEARPSTTETVTLDCDGAESSGSDAAQHRSASAWVMTRVAAPASDSDGCIGHGPVAEQQAMRASGVGIQPAQTPDCPTTSARVKRMTDKLRLKFTTFQHAGAARPCQMVLIDPLGVHELASAAESEPRRSNQPCMWR